MKQEFSISIIVPLYNEQESFAALVKRIDGVIDTMQVPVEVVLVDDGSKDTTTMLMAEKALNDSRYQAVFLSRNHGHQLALSAGLSRARGTDGVFIIDGDLQDPPELLPSFYSKYKEEFDVVYAIRKKRKENIFKRVAYFSFFCLQR